MDERVDMMVYLEYVDNIIYTRSASDRKALFGGVDNHHSVTSHQSRSALDFILRIEQEKWKVKLRRTRAKRKKVGS